MNAITERGHKAVATMDDSALLDVMRNTLYPGAKIESVQMVLAYCRARRLDPMKKPVHIVPMWIDGAMRDVPLPGISSYRIDAARTGEYDGKSEPEFGPDVTRTFSGKVKRSGSWEDVSETVTFPAWCKVTVYRRGKAFHAKEFWVENYATQGKSEVPNAMWAKRPYGQLAKCAEAQALRMAFPEEVGGQPTAEEMEGKTLGQEQPVASVVVQDQSAPDDQQQRDPPFTLRFLKDQLSQFGHLDDIKGYLDEPKVKAAYWRAVANNRGDAWSEIVQAEMRRVMPDAAEVEHTEQENAE